MVAHASSSSSDASASHQAAAAATLARRRAVLGAAAAATFGGLLSLPQPASADVPKGERWCPENGAGCCSRDLHRTAAARQLTARLRRPPSAAGYEDTAVKLVAALREAISTDLSDAEERQVRGAGCGGTRGGQ